MADFVSLSVPSTLDSTLVKRTVPDQIVGAVFVVFPTMGTLLLAMFWTKLEPTALDIAIAAVLYVLTGIGVTAGYHRLATHRSFEASGFVKRCLLAFGSMAFQGPVARWVADHRRHHAFTDSQGDPHTPWSQKNRLTGLVWSHIGWLFSQYRTRVSKFAPDVMKDQVAMSISRIYLVLSVLSLLIPAILGSVFRFSATGFLSGFLLGGCARICLFQHATWAVNSLAHFSGKRNHQTGDRSTNNWVVALLTFGEGWHNNHHAVPRSARHGGTRQLDLTYLFIAGLGRIGAAKNIRETELF